MVYLKPVQIYYRLYYFIRKRLFPNRDYKITLNRSVQPIHWRDFILHGNSFESKNTFSFLNIAKKFEDKIDWNHDEFGKLWTYNLNYFDFLNQRNVTKEQGLELIQDYISSDVSLKDGLEPYTLSLRGINWVKFLSKNTIKSDTIDAVLFHHYNVLLHNLEFHLLGNHLLENGFSLLFGAYYFQDEKLYKKAKKILKGELDEQILEDGAHFELSPMYHQIILHRLLDCIQLVSLNNWKSGELLKEMIQKASAMLGWLKHVTYKSGNIPMVNDAAYGIAMSSEQLFDYAASLNIPINEKALSDSGYRKVENETYELFIDIGNVKPSYQPGHAHSDTFSFELHAKGIPIVVDTGTSTYEKNKLRNDERSTASHNTVQLGDLEQTQVWGGFRVAKRAKVIQKEEKETTLSATHDGYKKYGVLHERTFEWTSDQIQITDLLSKKTAQKGKAFFHLDSGLKKPVISENQVRIEEANISFDFENHSSIEIIEYSLAKGFNLREQSYKIIVTFDTYLQSTISL